MDAEDLLMREFLGIRTREETALAANWIRSKQREDGSWATYYGGPADLSTTIEAYAALRLAGDPPEAST
jgi:squalene-hopene/tetraprenyl-beta-curcumene cyclase